MRCFRAETTGALLTAGVNEHIVLQVSTALTYMLYVCTAHPTLSARLPVEAAGISLGHQHLDELLILDHAIIVRV